MRKVFEDLQGDSLKPYYASFKSEQTKENYCIKLRLFLNFAELQVDEFVELAREKPSKVESILLEYVESRKKDEVSGSTIQMSRDAIKLLLDMNDAAEKINWKKINRILPAARHHGTDRPPTADEIRRLLLHADLKIKCVILLLVCSGIRIGALEYLTWGDLEPIKTGKHEFASLKVYTGEPEEYLTFITPECYEALLEYRKSREDAGEKVTKKSPLIAITMNERKIAAGSSAVARFVNSKVIRNKLGLLWKETGLRNDEEMDNPARGGKAATGKHEFKQAHGFRKFFKSECERLVKSIYVEMMMGHSTGVTASYMKPRIEDLADEYAKAIPSLTIMKSGRETKGESELKRLFLMASGKFTKEEIDQKQLAELPYDELQKVLQERLDAITTNGKRQIVVPVDEVKNYLPQGYDFHANLENGEVVLKLPL